MTKRAVALISGGMDSVTLAYDLADQGYELHLLSVDYGQTHVRELEFAEKAAEKLGAKHNIIDLKSVTKLLTGSSLTDRTIETPHGHYSEETMSITVVPNRNMTMLSIAWAVAVAENADLVGTAVHAGDHQVYPDCRSSFTEAFERAAQIGNEGFGNPDLRLYTPYVQITKADIVKRGGELGVPYIDTLSCYNGGKIINNKLVHCGRCSTDIERAEAFYLAGVPDPTTYADSNFWKDVVKEFAARET